MIINQTSVPAPKVLCIQKALDSDGNLVSGSEAMDCTGLKIIDNFWGYDLHGQFQSSGIVGPAFKNSEQLTQISGQAVMSDAFYLSRGVTSTALDSVKKISGTSAFSRAFYSTSVTSTGLGNLEWLSGSNAFYLAFSGTQITNETFTNLWYVGDNTPLSGAFSTSTLISMSFPKLNVITNSLGATINYPVFYGCDNLQDVYFGGVTAGTFAQKKTQFEGLFYAGGQYTPGTGSAAPNGCTLHLPTNFDPNSANPAFDVTTLSGYPTFGGDAQYIHIVYDQTPIPVLLGADGKYYDRRFVYDTSNVLAWGYGSSTTKYYTNSNTLPSVGDTIYSNIACTTAVTTIDQVIQ